MSEEGKGRVGVRVTRCSNNDGHHRRRELLKAAVR